MLEKYVEEKFPRYFIHGKFSAGRVSVSHANGDVIGCSEADAEILIRQRDDVIDMLCRLADAFDKTDTEKFKAIWYGS